MPFFLLNHEGNYLESVKILKRSDNFFIYLYWNVYGDNGDRSLPSYSRWRLEIFRALSIDSLLYTVGCLAFHHHQRPGYEEVKDLKTLQNRGAKIFFAKQLSASEDDNFLHFKLKKAVIRLKITQRNAKNHFGHPGNNAEMARNLPLMDDVN